MVGLEVGPVPSSLRGHVETEWRDLLWIKTTESQTFWGLKSTLGRTLIICKTSIRWWNHLLACFRSFHLAWFWPWRGGYVCSGSLGSPVCWCWPSSTGRGLMHLSQRAYFWNMPIAIASGLLQQPKNKESKALEQASPRRFFCKAPVLKTTVRTHLLWVYVLSISNSAFFQRLGGG